MASLGVLVAKILEAKYEVELEFPEGRKGGAKQTTFHGRSMGIFWICIIPVRRSEVWKLRLNIWSFHCNLVRQETLLHIVPLHPGVSMGTSNILLAG